MNAFVTKHAWWLLAGALWIVSIGAGTSILWRYASTQGAKTRAPTDWPATTRLQRADNRWTLVMFVHPHCPCTRASMAELGKLTARLRGRMSTTVVFERLDDDPPDFVEGGLRTQAAGLPDTSIVDDLGDEAKRFGAETSGAVVLYDASGARRFSGGLTSIRGHEGDSVGQERITALVTAGSADGADSPVFGCALDAKEEKGQ